MIRHSYIQKNVLNIYAALPILKFPLDLSEIIKNIPNCRYMSYQEFAKLNNCTIDEVIQLCESKSGCTHYDITNDRYLILCNQSTSNNNNLGRQRWTLGHEIGHTVCQHLALSAYHKLSENSLLKITNPNYEAEADYFAATLLCPFPICKLLNVQTPEDIQNIFGLSVEASLYRFKEYNKWLRSHIKTAWENDIVRLYKSKSPDYAISSSPK